MKFIRLSFKLAGQYKNRLKAGMFLIFLQNASMLFGFFALFLASVSYTHLTLPRAI